MREIMREFISAFLTALKSAVIFTVTAILSFLLALGLSLLIGWAVFALVGIGFAPVIAAIITFMISLITIMEMLDHVN